MFRTIELDAPWYLEKPNDDPDADWLIQRKTFKVVDKEEPFHILELKGALDTNNPSTKEQKWYDLDDIPLEKPSETPIPTENTAVRKKQPKKKKKKKKLVIVHNGKIQVSVHFKGVWMLRESAIFLKSLQKHLRQSEMSEDAIKEKLEELMMEASEIFTKYKILHCKHCDANGHRKDRCPKKVDKNTNICYKCGSLQHNLLSCPESSSHLAFALCTKCKEVGHEAYQCTYQS